MFLQHLSWELRRRDEKRGLKCSRALRFGEEERWGWCVLHWPCQSPRLVLFFVNPLFRLNSGREGDIFGNKGKCSWAGKAFPEGQRWRRAGIQVLRAATLGSLKQF